MTKITKMKKKISKKKIVQKEFHKKSIKNYQKINNNISGNGQTDIVTYRVA